MGRVKLSQLELDLKKLSILEQSENVLAILPQGKASWEE